MSTELAALVAELRELEAKATPRPWESQYARDGHTALEINRQFSGSFVCAVAPRQQVRSHHEGGVFPSADQELIAAARNALPALLDALETAQARIATLEEDVAAVAEFQERAARWVNEARHVQCPDDWAECDRARNIVRSLAALRAGKEKP